MKSLTKYPVAIILSALVILLSIALGQAKHREAAVPIPEPAPAGQQSSALDPSLPTAEYQKFILDDANLLSVQTKEEISRYNANFDKRYGSIVAVVAVKNTAGEALDAAAYRYAEMAQLSQKDALLLLSIESGAAYLAVGNNFFPQWDSADIESFNEKRRSIPNTVLGKPHLD